MDTNTDTDTITIEYEAADVWRDEFSWTFNYSWRRHGTMHVKRGLSNAAVTRRVKRALELSGLRHTQLWGDGEEYAARINGSCVGFNWRVVC